MKLLRIVIGIAISLVCLWLAVRNVPFADLSASLVYANPLWLVSAVFVQLLAVVARAQRWVVLLGTTTRFFDSFWAQGIGYLFTNIFPLRMGEPARVLVMSERSGLSIMHVAASALIERLLDISAILLAVMLALPFIDIPDQLRRGSLSVLTLMLVAVGLLFALSFFRALGESLVRFVCRLFPVFPQERILSLWRELVDGFSILSRPRVTLNAMAWSVAIWTLSIATYWCVLCSIQPLASFLEATFMLASLSLAVSLPSSPGFVGVFQWVGQQALVLPFGDKYNLASALAITMLAHIIYYAFTSLLGVIGLARVGTSFLNIRKTLFKNAKPV